MASGRLHLTGVLLLAPHLTPANADELLDAAAGKSKAEIEALLAERFPRSELLPLVEGLPVGPQLAPERVRMQVGSPAPARIDGSAPPSRVVPAAPERFALHLTISQQTHDKLRYAQALLGHQVSSGEIAEVLDRALDALIHQLERRKFAATSRPRPRPRHSSANPRHIPAAVKRAVWERDGGQCTFVSPTGQRCPARSRLEYDHVQAVARGGRATVEGIRLRCRGHNQYEAERTFGAGFMSEKREAAARARAAKAVEDAREREARAAAETRAQEVVPWLRALGFRADEARRAAEACAGIPEAPLEERVKLAVRSLGRGPVMVGSVGRAP